MQPILVQYDYADRRQTLSMTPLRILWMSGDNVLRKPALHAGEQIFENSVFSKVCDKSAMDSFRGSREIFGTLFSDPKKYTALKKPLAAILYREFRQKG